MRFLTHSTSTYHNTTTLLSAPAVRRAARILLVYLKVTNMQAHTSNKRLSRMKTLAATMCIERTFVLSIATISHESTDNTLAGGRALERTPTFIGLT